MPKKTIPEAVTPAAPVVPSADSLPVPSHIEEDGTVVYEAPKNPADTDRDPHPVVEQREAFAALAEAEEDSDKAKALRLAAEQGWETFAKEHEDVPGWGGLDEWHRFGLLSHVASIVNNPYQETYAGIATGPYHRQYKELDNALREALGYSVVHHP